MGFQRLAAIFLAALLLGLPAAADSLTDMSMKCGDLPSSPQYSQAEYIQVLADADAATKAAKKAKNTKAANEIGFKVNRIKQCQKLDLAKFPIPPYKDCATFISDANRFATWAGIASREKLATDDQIKKVKEGFKPLAEKCLREVMKECVNPLDTQAVLDAVEAVETARKFITVPSLAKETGLGRAVLEYNPFTSTLKFCADTDYACKSTKINCMDRVESIKSAFQSWIGN